jgi:hypothetical protein
MAQIVQLAEEASDNEKFTMRSAPARLPGRKPNAEYRRLNSCLTDRGNSKFSSNINGGNIPG